MNNFEELENSHSRLPVHLTNELGVSGFLTLNGRETRAILLSKDLLNVVKDENGWFDLELRAPGNRRILFHNSLSMKSIRHGLGSQADYEQHIFPNVVVSTYEKVDLCVRSISFTMKGLNYFFHYGYVEWQSACKDDAELVEAIKTIRRRGYKYNSLRGYDFFRPHEIYIIHSVPRIIKFRAESRYYEIHIGQSSGGVAWGDINVKTEPIAVIVFDKPTLLDEALERVFEWQQFFVQVAMEPLSLEGLTTRGERSWRAPSQDVYLPQLRKKSVNIPTSYQLHPGEIPFNFWDDRHHLRNVMQNWLLNGSSRAKFRGSLNRVIEGRISRSDLSDLVGICAGLEALPDLSVNEKFGQDAIELMANAAFLAIRDKNFDVDIERIRGVLSILDRPSLSNRLRVLASHIQSVLPLEVSHPIIKATPKLRNLSAHGGSFTDRIIPMVAPVVEGLASMCTIFDLVTSGMPSVDSERRSLKAIGLAFRASKELESLGVN